MQQAGQTALIDRLREAPIVHNRQHAARVLAELAERAQQDAALAPLAASMKLAPACATCWRASSAPPRS